MRRLILVRHGNTFGPDDRVVWVGKTNDLPLVESGLAQGTAVGKALKKSGIEPQAIFSSPLIRARETAQRAVAELEEQLLVQIDGRLNELDYGLWAGKSNEEIAREYSEKPLLNWSAGIWQGEYFAGSEESVRADIQSFADYILQHFDDGSSVVAVSSNGVLRYFRTLEEGSFESAIADGTLKVKTGHLCVLEHDGSSWRVVRWNVSPEEFGC